MLNELKKIVNGRYSLAVWSVFILLICLLPCLFLGITDYSSRNNYYLIEYKNDSELRLIINQYTLKYNADATKEAQKKNLDAIELYTFLYDNNMSYDEVRIDQENIISSSRVSYYKIVSTISSIVMFFLLVIVNIKIFNVDVNSKTYKYLYNNPKDSIKLYFRKVLASVLISCVLFIICITLIIFASYSFSLDFKYVIYTTPYVYCVSVEEYILNSCIYFLLFYLFSEIILVTISGLFLGALYTWVISAFFICFFCITSVFKVGLSYVFAIPLWLQSAGVMPHEVYITLIIRLIIACWLFCLNLVYLMKWKFINNIIYLEQED